jgi:thiol-disulfide isomerase/thioredoxin
MKVFMSLLLLSQASLASAKVLAINEGNFLEKTEGKAVFMKFYEPGCTPCHEMEADFEKLANDWEGDKIGLVAEINCLDPGSESLCDDFEISE